MHDDVIYMISDVHYYLGETVLANQKRDDYYSCVGGNFFPVPGKYVLPFNEGMVCIDGKNNVQMRPRRSGMWYSHPLVQLTNVTLSLDFGWYSLALSDGNPKDFHVHTFSSTGHSTEESI